VYKLSLSDEYGRELPDTIGLRAGRDIILRYDSLYALGLCIDDFQGYSIAIYQVCSLISCSYMAKFQRHSPPRGEFASTTPLERRNQEAGSKGKVSNKSLILNYITGLLEICNSVWAGGA